MAQKVIEEAAEVAIDAVQGERDAVIAESVDLLYSLTFPWCSIDITPSHVWAEMDGRQASLGIVEKLPKLGDIPT